MDRGVQVPDVQGGAVRLVAVAEDHRQVQSDRCPGPLDDASIAVRVLGDGRRDEGMRELHEDDRGGREQQGPLPVDAPHDGRRTEPARVSRPTGREGRDGSREALPPPAWKGLQRRWLPGEGGGTEVIGRAHGGAYDTPAPVTSVEAIAG